MSNDRIWGRYFVLLARLVVFSLPVIYVASYVLLFCHGRLDDGSGGKDFIYCYDDSWNRKAHLIYYPLYAIHRRFTGVTHVTLMIQELTPDEKISWYLYAEDDYMRRLVEDRAEIRKNVSMMYEKSVKGEQPAIDALAKIYRFTDGAILKDEPRLREVMAKYPDKFRKDSSKAEPGREQTE
ncbi:MAG: hypothetical protein ACYTEQ_27095 [Planctomycetota bacterium]